MTEHRCRDRMAQHVCGTAAWAGYARAGEGSIDDHRHGTMRAERTKRCATADEDHIRVCVRPALCEVRDQRVSYLTGERQTCLTSAFTRDVNPGCSPVNVAEPQLHDIAGAQSQARHQ